MPNRCVCYGCNNITDVENGISLHKIPFFNDVRPEAKRRRKRWIDFVSTKRKYCKPSCNSSVCSVHFKCDDFARMFRAIEGQDHSNYSARLKSDEFGIVAYPTVNCQEEKSTLSKRSRRQCMKELTCELQYNEFSVHERQENNSDKVDEMSIEENSSMIAESAIETARHERQENVNNGDKVDEMSIVSPFEENASMIAETAIETARPLIRSHEIEFKDQSSQTFCQLETKVRMLKNKQIDYKELINKQKEEIRSMKNEIAEMKEKVCDVQLGAEYNDEVYTESDSDGFASEQETEDDSIEFDSEVEPEYDTDFEPDSQTETETENESEIDEPKSKRVSCNDDNLRTQPKFIAFLSQLLLLFKFCPMCKADNPIVDAKQVGTMAEIITLCRNFHCPNKESVWRSQPNMTGTKIPAGNFLLSFAILVAGGSASKVFNIFSHMGLACYSLPTFLRHQRSTLFPSILLFWKSYREKMLQNLKAIGEPLVIAGDGRYDSMGHSAKYCAYTVFSSAVPAIIHFSLDQKNEAGSSPAMEFMAFKQSIHYLINSGMNVSTLITDRHLQIAKYMREILKNITHYFDLWHLKKKIRKVLSKLSKEKGCEAIVPWIRPCENHLLWSALSTSSGNSSVIWAKFKSYLSHIIDKHDNLDDPLLWGNRVKVVVKKNSTVYDKIVKVLEKPSLVKGIKKASPLDQTSCLEGFHSVVNQFAPKMIAYSFNGMFCRHILAAIHFNTNLNRDVKKGVDGKEQIHIVYPKFKNGEATVRNVRVPPNFDYVEEIYQEFLIAQKGNKLSEAIQELKEMTPAPMNTMLDKQPKEEAILKCEQRKEMKVIDVPPTTPVLPKKTGQQMKKKLKPSCKKCKRPMKGHKYTDCLKNK